MRRFVLVVLALAFGSGAAAGTFSEEVFVGKKIPAYSIPTPSAGRPPETTVIGRVRLYRIRTGDTLMDLARYFDLGYNEIVVANPGIDPWVPPVGAIILLPTEWVLPCCTYQGLVVNIPEMRLYFYRPSGDDPGTTIVRTYPVGLGRDEWRTPRGKFKIRGKTVNPTWNIPPSIQKERAAEKGDHRTSIAGGDPENPLGKHRIELTLPMYGIHGTNIPWGVGMQVSHGCLRLYPEDIERLFPLITAGLPGEFTYQPVKAGRRDGVVYVEAHKDIYAYTPALYGETTNALARAGLAGMVDEGLVVDALEDPDGMPVRVSPERPAPSARQSAGRVPGGTHGRVPHTDHLQARDG
jgi:L,D-transpeptidase ErfK/SrfK